MLAYWKDNKWPVIESYFREYGLVRHQIESYNRFVLFDIEKTIRDEPHLVYKRANGEVYSLKFFGVTVDRPTQTNDDRTQIAVYPRDARLNGTTYESHVFVQVEEKTVDDTGAIVKYQVHNRILLAKIPCMLRSDVCHLTYARDVQTLDENPTCQGGYFIIHGKERVIVGQMRNAYNTPIVCWKGQDLVCEMRSMSEESGHSVLITLKISWSFQITIQLPHTRDTVPLAIVFKALGVTDEELPSTVGGRCQKFRRYYTRMFLDSHDCHDPMAYIAQFMTRRTVPELLLDVELFPHLGINSSRRQIVASLALMTKMLFSVHCGRLLPTDVHAYNNKRVEMCGYLMTDLFKMLYKKFLKTLYMTLEKQHRIELNSLNKQAGITNGLAHCFATGSWGVQRNNYIRTGVSQVPHPKLSSMCMYSAMRRIYIPNGKEGKNNKIRQLHPSSMFFVCTSETPEGQSIGVVLNMAVFCHVSHRVGVVIVIQLIDRVPVVGGNTPLFVNGIYVKSIGEPLTFLERVGRLKLDGVLPYDVSYFYNSDVDVFDVQCDAGRLIRPLLRLDSRSPPADAPLSFRRLHHDNNIEYMCASQIERVNIAMDPDACATYPDSYVYMELEPTAMMGIVANFIPFSNHTQSPRVCYQSSMSKQAIGFISTVQSKMDSTSYTLNYLHRPLCETKMSQAFQVDDEMVNGCNVVVAIACFSGYNQEDSLILNKSALDRGLFSIQANKVFVVEEKCVNSIEKICMPPPDKRKLHFNYSHLDADGIVKLKTKVKGGDIIVGRLITRINKKDYTTYDDSIAIKPNDEGQVVKIERNPGKTGMVVKIMISTCRVPEIGDKFCSNSAQKGTCGMIFDQEDMPFNSQGMCPDLIINPHCIPSRMTINQLMACVVGKIKCVTTKNYEDLDGTPFENKRTFDELCDILRDEGWSRDGCEKLTNGMTGEEIEAAIFMGPTYYHRLKHLVADKIHARAQGQMTTLTRQPNCGRSKNGGLRIGEMEKDSLLVHGVSKFIRERLFELSDYFVIYICKKCGIMSAHISKCHVCDLPVYKTSIPYAAKLLLQELNGTGIKTKIEIK